MNGRFTSSVSFGDPGLSNFIDTNLVNRTNSNDLWFPWSNNIQANASQSYAVFSGKSTSPSTDVLANDNYRPPQDPWGFGSNQNPIIDDNELVQSSVDHSLPNPEPVTSSLIGSTSLEISGGTEVADEAATVLDAVKVPEALAEGAESATPWGLAALVAQQLGQVTSQALMTQLQNQSTSDFAQNIQQHGLSTTINADIIRSQQDNTIRNQNLGGTIGSFFGPLGALLGHAIAGYASANPTQLATAGSFQGWINPEQSNIVASAQTSSDNGQDTQVDNVDTTNVSQ